MGRELESAFSDYLALVRESFALSKDGNTRLGNLVVLEPEGQRVRNLSEAAENREAFAKLVAATAEAFSRESSNDSSSTWKSAVQNFFRRSGLYQRIFAGQGPEDAADCKKLYEDAFSRNEVKVTYFAPLELVSFDEKRMDFGDFWVQRFTKVELDQKLQQAMCRIFYPWASTDIGLLAQYWFLVCSEVKPSRKLGSMKVTLDIRVKPKHSRFPKPVEEALKRLVLFSWGTQSHPLQSQTDLNALECWDAPVTFGVPFVIPVSDSLTDHITAMPSTAGLNTIPAEDPETGEYLGEQPLSGVYLDQGATDAHRRTNQQFVTFVQWADGALKSALAQAPFIDLALAFLVTGFFSEGLEQLLWHITAIEAALGENREGGITALLKNRVGLILGDSEQESKSYAKCFGELYDFRCALVHGDERLTSKEANLAHLGLAREIARRVTLWMVNYLCHILLSQPASPVSRDDLLAALDVNPRTRPAVAEILSRLPAGFPQVREWRA